MRVFEQTVVRNPNLEPALREVNACATTRRTQGIEVIVAATSGKPGVIADGGLIVGERGAAQSLPTPVPVLIVPRPASNGPSCKLPIQISESRSLYVLNGNRKLPPTTVR